MNAVFSPITQHAVETGLGCISVDLFDVDHARGAVTLVNVIGQSRLNARKRYVAEQLREAGFLTVLVDLLRPAEIEIDHITERHRLETARLSKRLEKVVEWVEQHGEPSLPLGLMSFDFATAVAMTVAIENPDWIQTAVSYNGRMELLESHWQKINIPLLLIVSQADQQGLATSQRACEHMSGQASLQVLSNGHSSGKEPHHVREIARLSQAWFEEHLYR